MCDTFIRRPHEFLGGGEATTKQKGQNYSRSACIAELIMSR